ncbi:MAG: ribonuclease P protein component [Halothiobacillaceae bacterium]|nr:ribonuclease P protein component [Halothiobacillaceae bacterium]HER35527.1 ribonuclease P protein component [Halothiobacillaceae bacterium]
MIDAPPEARSSRARHAKPVAPPGGRFPRAVRLLTANDYQGVMRGRERVHTPHLMLALRCQALGPARLGLAVSRKRVRLAHERNRIKRVAREQFRLALAELPGMDIVVLAKPGADGLSLSELHGQMKLALTKASRKCAVS